MRSMILSTQVALFLTTATQTALAATTCEGIRLETDMRCCMQTCPGRPGGAAMVGTVQRPPNGQTLFNLRKEFQMCQGLDERNNFYACERADKKGPYNTGRRILGLPPG
jgi:hypothetical protein